MIPRILIVYGTTDGQTRKIAVAVGATLESAGCHVHVFEAASDSDTITTDDYDGVIVAASIHVGNFQRRVRRWVRAHTAQLNRVPSALLCVCLAILENRPEPRRELQGMIDRLLERSGWQPSVVRTVAGAVPYTHYNWLKKWIMKRILTKTGGGTDTTRDYEYTDWNDLRDFATAFARRVRTLKHGTPTGGRVGRLM